MSETFSSTWSKGELARPPDKFDKYTIRIQPEYNQNTTTIRPQYDQNTTRIQLEYNQNTIRMHQEYSLESFYTDCLINLLLIFWYFNLKDTVNILIKVEILLTWLMLSLSSLDKKWCYVISNIKSDISIVSTLNNQQQ